MQDLSPLRVTFKLKKIQTVACDACKMKKRKCTGTLPCDYCVERNFLCHYSPQKKRGKKKVEPSPGDCTNLKKAQTLWSKTERFGSVEKFCGMRWWWRNLLDFKRFKQYSSLSDHAQMCIINAWLARLSKDHDMAEKYYHMARSIALSNGIQDDDSVSVTTLYILLSDFNPEREYNHRCCQMAQKIKSTTNIARRIRFYATSVEAFSHGTEKTYCEMLECVLNLATEAMDLWDTVYFLCVKTYLGILSKIEHLVYDGTLYTLTNLSFDTHERDALMVDVMITETLIKSQPHLFGYEYDLCLQFSKVFLLWIGNDKEKAVQEAIKNVEYMEQNCNSALFLTEVKNLMLPLMILNEVGIKTYNDSVVTIIEEICKETKQNNMLEELTPLFAELRLPTHNPSSYSKLCNIPLFLLGRAYNIINSPSTDDVDEFPHSISPELWNISMMQPASTPYLPSSLNNLPPPSDNQTHILSSASPMSDASSIPSSISSYTPFDASEISAYSPFITSISTPFTTSISHAPTTSYISYPTPFTSPSCVECELSANERGNHYPSSVDKFVSVYPYPSL